MDVEKIHESKECRKAARNLFTAVGKLMDEAVRTDDLHRRREIYLQAMSMSDQAYNLLGKARKCRSSTRAG